MWRTFEGVLFDPDRPVVEDLLLKAFDLDRAGKQLGLNAFDNNCIRELIICRQTDLLWNPGRGETDALSRADEEYELKSTDIARGPSPNWPTSREVSREVLRAFRSMDYFAFAVFDGIDLLALYRASAADLEPFFKELDARLTEKEGVGKNLNNPKFPWRVVKPVSETILLDPRFTEPPA